MRRTKAIIRILALVAASALLLSAQYQSISVNRSGSVCYFSTALRQKGTVDPVRQRIWKVDVTGSVQLVFDAFGRYSGSPVGVEISDDESVMAVAIADGNRVITPITSNPPGLVNGSARISANGRYVLGWRPTIWFDLTAGTGYGTYIEDYPALSPGASRAVSNTGVAIAVTTSKVWLLSPGNSTYENVYVAPQDGTTLGEGVIDATARTAIFTMRPLRSAGRELWLLDVVSKQARRYLWGNGDLYSPMLSGDGRTVAFLSTANFGTTDPPGAPQIFTLQIDGSGFHRLTDEPSGVKETALSGDGSTMWYLSGKGDLKRINLQDPAAVAATILPVPTSCCETSSRVVRGSVSQLRGNNFVEGTRVILDGFYAPMISVMPDELTFQTPWEAGAGTGSVAPVSVALRLEAKDTASPFESRVAESVLVYESSPQLSSAVHPETGQPVTDSDPARPGESLYLYGSGFGRIDREAKTGEPGPSDPPAKTLDPVSCRATGFAGGVITLPVSSAVFSPDGVGLYRLEVILPNDRLIRSLPVSCNGSAPWYLPVAVQ